MGAVLLALVVLLASARLGASLAERLAQPAVLGELAAGILLGALPLLGMSGFAYAASDGVVAALAELGVILLLFEVGLSTRLADLLRVGPSALSVAVVGMAVPMGLGYAAGHFLLPGRHPFVPLFLGATLCATSVGITARVLKDLGRVNSIEGQIILGAAVIDDVLGLLVLAVMVGLVGGEGAALPTLAKVGGKAVAFLTLALVVGRWAAPRFFRGAARLHGKGVLFTFALVACLGLAWLAEVAGLAPIVGAFAAGLVLEGVPWDELLPDGDRIEELFLPLSTALVPIFFVRMGLQVDLRALAGGPLLLALALILAALLGKQACGLAVLRRGVDRLAVGIGMVPRGEVGLIFAGIGMSLKLGGASLLGPGELAAVVAMVLVTTLVTPPLLRWRLSRAG